MHGSGLDDAIVRKLKQQLIKDLEYNKLIKEMSKDDRGEWEFSDLKLERKSCDKCGATWINGQHIWSGTGAVGNEDDLAGLVCNKLGDLSVYQSQERI